MASALLVISGSGTLEAKDVDGVFRWFVTRNREMGSTGQDWGTTFDVRYHRPISSALSYLASVRSVYSRTQAFFTVDPLETTASSQLEPRLELRWNPGTHELSLGFRRLETRDRPEGRPDTTRREANLFGRFATLLEDRPRLTAEWDRREIRSDAGADITISRLRGGLEYQRAGWSGSLGRRHDVTDNAGSLRRTIDEDLLATTFTRRLDGGRWSVFASYNLQDVTARDELDTQTLVAVPRAVLRGLSALDPLPLDGSLGDTPSLVDGNRAAATAVNIGGGLAGGQTGWNIGVELPLLDPVDVIDLWLAAPIPAANATSYVFEVYRSDDNLAWTRVSPAAGRVYDPFDGRFRLTFPAATARFVKVVNVTVDDALGAVFVSEIEVFGQELRAGRIETDSRNQNASANLTWVPGPAFSASVSGFANAIESEREGQTTRVDTSTGDLSLSFQPTPALLGSFAIFGSRQERSSAEPETERLYSLSLTALALDDLDLTMAASRRDQTRGSIDAESESVLLGVALLLYRDLSLAVDYGIAHEESPEALARNRHTLRATLSARPRSEIELTSSLLDERIEIPAEPTGDRTLHVVNWSNRLVVRPSSLLSVVLQATYFELPDDDGWSRVLQVDWLPFAGGTVQLSVDFREDLPLAGQARRIRSTRLRWNLNRQTFLDLELARSRQELPGAAEIRRESATAFFQARF